MGKIQLVKIRKQINAIDKEIIALLKKRSFIIPKVRKIKENWDYKIAFKREVDMAKSLQKKDFGLYNNTFMQAIWRQIISATLKIECDLKIEIYKNPSNFYELWELSKDFFGVASNYHLNHNIENMFEKLINQQVDALVLPAPEGSSLKWWLNLIKPQYQRIKINMVFPFLHKFQTLCQGKAMCLSLNNNDVFPDNYLYIIKGGIEQNKNTTILDSHEDLLFIATSTPPIGMKTDFCFYVGSYANAI
jgi:chorismate mutase